MKIYGLFLAIFFVWSVPAQTLRREFSLSANNTVEIINLFGRVEIAADETKENSQEGDDSANVSKSSSNAKEAGQAFLTAENALETDLKIVSENNRLSIVVSPANLSARVDLFLKIPEGSRVRIETGAGEIRLSGNIAEAVVKSETGTISTNVPTENLRYDFVWTESRPRFLSDVELGKVKEKAGGKFVLNGKIIGGGEKKAEENSEENARVSGEQPVDEQKPKNKKQKTKNRKPKPIELNFTTARGIILLNVPLNEVSPDLRERPLTEAAKAIIRSGDSILTSAIRRASPKYFGEYARTLPPLKQEPVLRQKEKAPNRSTSARAKRILVRVTDLNNRAVADLRVADFDVTENGERREILSVTPTSAPFNLILLLDVSGSIDNYVDFIRKAARAFVETASRDDRISIIIFNEDVKTLSTFTTEKGRLSQSLDTFDAGGGTAFYDAIGYVLSETLRPLKGERTAIVTLTDGDDNRSFLPFDSLLGAIQESGALVYPLYVPSGLIAATANSASTADPLRAKYMSLTSKSEGEGEKLAQISGGVYYPISRLSQIQSAYEDIVRQLRTAYSVTFRSGSATEKSGGNRASPRLKIKINRENTFVKLGSVVEVSDKQSYQLKPESFPQSAQLKSENFQTIDFTEHFSKIAENFFSAQNSFGFAAPLREISFRQSNEISGEVERINYKQFLGDNLRETKFETFDVNASSGAFLLANDAEKIAVSRWISPKRTRSYPYERVYDTLRYEKKATIIPVLKDEGLGGERDFLQWDTMSLMSLLNVFVVPAFYINAAKNTKRADQITEQKLDNRYVAARLKEIFAFDGTARDWNEAQAKQLKSIFERARDAYREISKKTKTYLHDETVLNQLIKLAENPNTFAEFSRVKSRRGQSRELQSIQPKEALFTDTKGGVTITNLAGGKYFFTCDETIIENGTLSLIEDKHSQRAILPSENDIKDGLLKMMVYINLKNVRVGKNLMKEKSVLRLTSSKLLGSINSNSGEQETVKFFETNSLDIMQRNFLQKLFKEARENDFTIILEKAETAK